MFDVGFSELVVIAVVALVVIGPERLPRVARTAGILLGRLQRYVNDVKADINREINLDEIKKLQQDVTDQARSLESSMKQQIHQVETALSPEQLSSPTNPEPVAAETAAASEVATTLPSPVEAHKS